MQTTVNGEYDLKVVWVNDVTDDRYGHIRSANTCNLHLLCN